MAGPNGKKPKREKRGVIPDALSLSTKFKRANINIDGTDYSMKSPEEFGFVDLNRIDRCQKQLSAMQKTGEFSDEQAAGLASMFVDTLALVLPDAPRDVLERLPDSQKMRALGFFSARARQAATDGPETTRKTPNGS